jgi:hypothetical protein
MTALLPKLMPPMTLIRVLPLEANLNKSWNKHPSRPQGELNG